MATNNPNQKLPPDHMTDGEEPEWGEITGYVTRNGTAKYLTEPFDNKENSHELTVNHDATWTSKKADGTTYNLSDTERNYKLGSESNHTDGQVASYTESNFNIVARLSHGITTLKSAIVAAGEKAIQGTGGSSFQNDTGGNSWRTSSGDLVDYRDGSVNYAAEKDFVISANENAGVVVQKDYNVWSGQSATIASDQKLNLYSEGAMLANTLSTMALKSTQAMTINSSATMTVGATGDITIESSSKLTLKVGGASIEITSAGIKLVGTRIDLN